MHPVLWAIIGFVGYQAFKDKLGLPDILPSGGTVQPSQPTQSHPSTSNPGGQPATANGSISDYWNSPTTQTIVSTGMEILSGYLNPKK